MLGRLRRPVGAGREEGARLQPYKHPDRTVPPSPSNEISVSSKTLIAKHAMATQMVRFRSLTTHRTGIELSDTSGGDLRPLSPPSLGHAIVSRGSSPLRWRSEPQDMPRSPPTLSPTSALASSKSNMRAKHWARQGLSQFAAKRIGGRSILSQRNAITARIGKG